MIEIQGVNKAYHGYPVLSNVSMKLECGEVVGFVGANGSGKTLLLKTICGFIQPDRGKVLFEGKQIGKEIDFPPETGIMIEEPGFYQAYSARQNLRLLASHRGRLNDQQVDAAIASIGLDASSRKPVGKYSMGMRQRLCFAQAVMEQPTLLILDEPFNSLDQKWADWLREEIKRYSSPKRLILLTSHRKEDIDLLCTRTFLFVNGNVSSDK
ncbi:MAG: ATP-binding cassette domain-containing protein [Clostridia bacterium]